MRPIRVHKLRPDGTEVFAWQGHVVRESPTELVLVAAFNAGPLDLGFTTFAPGDEFVEFYYADRWHNVFQVSAPDGTLKGWYCNVGTPFTLDPAGGDLSYVDLALDVWMAPDGTYLRLDEDEFAARVAAGAYSADLRHGAERGWADLLDLAERRALPRWLS